MTNQEMALYDRAFGLHSSIPSCCVEFYIAYWEDIWLRRDAPYRLAVDAAEFGYVPCPTCLGTNNKVRIKWCARECGGEHQEDFVPKRVFYGY